MPTPLAASLAASLAAPPSGSAASSPQDSCSTAHSVEARTAASCCEAPSAAEYRQPSRVRSAAAVAPAHFQNLNSIESIRLLYAIASKVVFVVRHGSMSQTHHVCSKLADAVPRALFFDQIIGRYSSSVAADGAVSAGQHGCACTHVGKESCWIAGWAPTGLIGWRPQQLLQPLQCR